MEHKAGFVNIIGNPNVGKSTLMNALVGEKLSIITSKAQTTRHRIMGIVNGEDFQLVYSDTPGILKPNYKLQNSMLKFVDSALSDADVILYVTDVVETPGRSEDYLFKVNNSHAPVLLVINKIDLTNQEDLEKLVEQWKVLIPKAEIYPISALKNFNVTTVFDRIIGLTPLSPPYFPKDQLTDKTERFFMQEIIREKIFLNYEKEIPYSCEVLVDEYKDEPNIIRIRATIFVTRDSQKGILIGHKGSMLKKVGTQARLEAETFFGKKIFLEMHVKVLKDWRDKELNLRQFGYEQS